LVLAGRRLPKKRLIKGVRKKAAWERGGESRTGSRENLEKKTNRDRMVGLDEKKD